jgi:hypothetical protein
LKEINCKIGVKQGCPLSPTLFDIYIDNLEDCLEDAGYVGPTRATIIIILLLYVDDIVLMVKSPYDLGERLIILKDFFSSMDIIVNTNKTKIMIIKSKRISYDTLYMATIVWKKCLHIHHNLNWNYSVENMINGG